MAITLSNTQQFSFESKSLAPDTFQVVRFSGEESASALTRFEIELASRDPDVDLSAVLNEPATLTLRRGLEEVPYHGIVIDIEQAGEASGWYGYRAVLVSRLWLLSLNYQSRVFQNLAVPEIVEAVLRDSGFFSATDYELRLSAAYQEREYCVQFNESDFDFLSRLLEFEGIHYVFEQRDRDVLILSDRIQDHREIQGDAVVPYNAGAGLATSVESIRAFVCRERVVTGAFLVRDYFYGEPEAFVNAESRLNAQMPGRRYEYGGRLHDQPSGERIARVRNEEVECRRRTFVGDSDCVRFGAGRSFSLEGHFRTDFGGSYVLTSVRHVGDQKAALPGMGGDGGEASDGAGETYHNTFTCIPADVSFRPMRTTPAPRIPGVIAAKVESAGGDYAYVDDLGRYRVKMPFDTSDASDGTASLPVPHGQINAGPDCGVHFPLHESNDLLLAFVDGDVDRPFAIGSLPTPSNKSPVTSANNAQNVMRTMGGNEFVLDDTKDSAQVWLRSAEGHLFMLDDAHDRVVLTTTEQHQVSFDDGGRFIEVKTKDGHFVRMDDANEKLTVQSRAGHRISISDKDSLITMIDESGDHLFQIDIGSKQLSIKTASGGIDLQAPAGLIEIKAKELKVETSGDTSFKAANIKSEAQSNHKTKAMNITAEAAMDYKQKGNNVTSEAAIAHKIKGVQVKSEAAAMNEMQGGAAATLKSSGISTVQGSLVKIN